METLSTGSQSSEELDSESVSARVDRVPPGLPFRVLVAEDNPVFQTMVGSMLVRWGYEALVARDGLEAWRILESRDAPRVAILDWMMPGIDGVQLCRRVRAETPEPYIYILLLTSRTTAEDLVEGMDAGADDYLTKPFHPHELRVRLRAGRRMIELQQELVRTREALRVQATHDALTGLLNRAAVLESLGRELARAGREHSELSVLMADLDRFKLINDTFGHLNGDAVLRETAARMKNAIRSYDTLGRYGGEEFLLVLPGCDSQAACVQAERLRLTISAGPVELCGAAPLHVSCSMGVASLGAPPRGDAQHLLREADRALYKAKRLGRDRVEMAFEIPEQRPLAAASSSVGCADS